MTTTRTTHNLGYSSEPRDELVQKCVWCCLQLKLLGGQIFDIYIPDSCDHMGHGKKMCDPERVRTLLKY